LEEPITEIQILSPLHLSNVTSTLFLTITMFVMLTDDIISVPHINRFHAEFLLASSEIRSAKVRIGTSIAYLSSLIYLT
jgi:uncharacterized protein YqgC (DUF456 family)